MKRLWRDIRGVAALETGIVLPLLLGPLMTLMAGAGQAMMIQYQLDRGLHSALLTAWGIPKAAVATIQTAAQNGYGTGGATMTSTVSYACSCISPTGTHASGTVQACNTSCGGGQVIGTWVTVTNTASFSPVLGWTWGKGAWNLSATGTVRVY